MGRTLQVRGIMQVIELRTLNAEVNELLKVDIEEVDFRSDKALRLDQGDVDVEVSFADSDIDKTRFLLLKSDDPILVKIDATTNTSFATCFMIINGAVEKLFLSAPTIATLVKILAFK